MDVITRQKILCELSVKVTTLSLEELKADPNLIVTPHGSDTGRNLILVTERSIAAAETENAELRANGLTSSKAYERNEKMLAITRPLLERTREFEAKRVLVTDRRLKPLEEQPAAAAETV